MKKSVPSILVIAALVTSLSVPKNCFASPAPVPFWLKEGAYAYYFINFTVLSFLNGSGVWKGNSTYGWKCVGLAGNNATLDVYVNITGKLVHPNEIKATSYFFEQNYIVYIDVETREATCGGIYLGFLPYWITTDVEHLPLIDPSRLPAGFPDLGWQVIENFTTYDNVTAFGLLANVSYSQVTPYKTFQGAELWAIPGQFSSTRGFTYVYEKVSGLWVLMGIDNFLLKILEVEAGTKNVLLLDTNIHALPEPPSPFAAMQPYIVTATIIAATATTIYAVNAKRRPKPQTQHQKPEATTQH